MKRIFVAALATILLPCWIAHAAPTKQSTAQQPAAPATSSSTVQAMPMAIRQYGTLEHVLILGNQPIELTTELKPEAPRAILRVKSLKYELQSDGMKVHFVVDSGDVVTMQQVRLTRPLLQDQKIKLRDGSVLHEPVVKLEICVGHQRLTVPFTLLVRNNYTPAMTLGQVQTTQLGVIKPKAHFLHEPDCSDTMPAAASTAPRA